jgi:ABC-type multidrug transport system, permease component
MTKDNHTSRHVWLSAFRASFRRIIAMFIKEFLQLARDRVTFSMMLIMPINLLILFGYAIDTNPRHLPTAVFVQDNSPFTRTFIASMISSKFFDIRYAVRTEEEFDYLLASGKVQFAIRIPSDFGKNIMRGENPSILFIADASDPTAIAGAEAALNGFPKVAIKAELKGAVLQVPALSAQANADDPFTIILHRRNNPTANTQMNIVPGLIGVILTLTMLIFTSMAVTRETEQGTMENLLSMPIRPFEIMLGKIAPYVVVGAMEMALILVLGRILFSLPMLGSLSLLVALTLLFVIANLALGYSFSTIAESQLQAMQMSFFFFLPSILLSGFMFPFYGMPEWAQILGELLPLTHYLRIVRGIMLKATTFADLQGDVLALFLFTLAAMLLAIARFKQTLD